MSDNAKLRKALRTAKFFAWPKEKTKENVFRKEKPKEKGLAKMGGGGLRYHKMTT
jgi:hypothetical protein